MIGRLQNLPGAHVVQTRAPQTSPEPEPHSTPSTPYGERHDVRSLAFALGGTFVLRCASYAAGLIIPVSLGIKSRTDSEVTASYASLIGVAFYSAELIGAPIFGALSDRFGRKPFMLLGPIFGGFAIQLLGITATGTGACGKRPATQFRRSKGGGRVGDGYRSLGGAPVHRAPSQCSMSAFVALRCQPTAHTSFELIAATAVNWLSPVSGVAILVHFQLSQ